MSIADLCSTYIKNRDGSKDGRTVDVLNFIEAPWGLGLGTVKGIPPLYPVQKIIIKCYYGLELDKGSDRNIIIKDKFAKEEKYRFNEAEYIEFLYNEGRCNIKEIDKRYVNMLMVCGRRSGKCITGDSLVLTDKGIYRIEDMVSAKRESFSPLSVGVIQEARKKSESKYFYNGGIKPTFKVKTHCGCSITGTANHRIKVMSESGNIEWRFLDDVKAGDFVAINRGTDLWAKKMVDVTEYHNDEGKKKVNFPKYFNEYWANLLGYLVGDGTWNERMSTNVTVEHPETWTYLKNLYKKLFGDYKIQMDKRTRNTGCIRFSSTGMRRFFHNIGFELGTNRFEKKIPWIIFRSPKKIVCAFLRGLFETDGGVENKGKRITFSSASFRLAYEMQILLFNIGIVSRVNKKWVKKTKRHYAILAIKGVESRKLFAKYIGFDSDKKMKPLLRANMKATEGKSNVDSIPHQKAKAREWVFSIEKFHGRMKLRNVLGNVIKNSGEDLTYRRIKIALDVTKKVSSGKKEREHFKRLLDCNYYYDKVTGIEESEDPVYDLTVPDGESFVANGFTNHNTTLTGAVIAYEMYKLLNMYSPQEFYSLMPDSEIKMTCVSTSKKSAAELFNMATGNMMRSEFFKRYRKQPTKETMAFQTQREVEKYGSGYHSRSTMLLRVAPCSAKGLRGPSNALVGLDEMAHFFEEEKVIGSAGSDMSERAIYDAVTPSVANFTTPNGEPDGKILCLSSPSTKSGKFYELYENSFKTEVDDWLMIQAPTWEVNPAIPHKFLLGKFRDGPIVYNVEYGAQFDDRLKGWIEDAEVVRQCIVPGMKFKLRSSERLPHFLGIDVGLKVDGTAMCVCHNVVEAVHGARETFIEVDMNDVRFAHDEGLPHFKPQDIAKWIMEINDRFLIVKGLMDQYYGMGIVPLLEEKGIKQIEYRIFNEQMNSNIYQNLLTQFISMTLKLPDGEKVKVGDRLESDSELVKELLSLQAHSKSKYIVKVEAPDREGCHDDRSDALSRAVLLATEYKSKGYGNRMATVISERAKSFRNTNKRRMRQASLMRPERGIMPSRMGMGMRSPYGIR